MSSTGGRKFLLGCLLASGAAIFLFVAVAIVFVTWVRAPAPPLEGTRLLDRSTAIYAELRLRSQDPGAREFARSFLTAMRQAQESAESTNGFRSVVRRIVGSAGRREVSEKEIERVLPVVVAVRREEGQEGRAGPAAYAASFAQAGNRVRVADWFFSFAAWRGRKVKAESHAGMNVYTIAVARAPMWVCFPGTDVLLSRDLDAAKSEIDAYIRAASSGADGSAHPFLRTRPAEANLFIASKPGYAGQVAETLEPFAPSTAALVRKVVRGPEGMRFWAAMRSADRLEGELRLLSPETKVSAEVERNIAGEITVPVGVETVRMALEPMAAAAGETHAWKIRITGLEKIMAFRVSERGYVPIGAPEGTGEENGSAAAPSEDQRRP